MLGECFNYTGLFLNPFQNRLSVNPFNKYPSAVSLIVAPLILFEPTV